MREWPRSTMEVTDTACPFCGRHHKVYKHVTVFLICFQCEQAFVYEAAAPPREAS